MKSWNYQIWLHIFTQFGRVLLPNLAVICYLIWRKKTVLICKVISDEDSYCFFIDMKSVYACLFS